MGVNFEIENEGPKLGDWTSQESLKKLKTLNPSISTPFVGETLRNLRREVGNEATVLGFIGAPFTLASYMIEGGSSEEFLKTKQMMYNSPETFHKLLNHLQENIANYAIYQIENGAQAIQIFDSWAGVLSPTDYDNFALTYQKKVIEKIKSVHPNVPIILFIAKSGSVLEKMAKSGADCISLDSTVTINDARKRMNLVCNKSSPSLAIQGNLDPIVLLGPKEIIRERTEAILHEGTINNRQGYVMNLGHGVNTNTPEENVEYFVNLVKNYQPKITKGWKGKRNN